MYHLNRSGSNLKLYALLSLPLCLFSGLRQLTMHLNVGLRVCWVSLARPCGLPLWFFAGDNVKRWGVFAPFSIPSYRVPWYRGWSFIRHITEKFESSDWTDLERVHYDVSQYMDRPFSKIQILRIWSRNDPIVHLQDIQKSLKSFVSKTVVTEGGGHCAVSEDKQASDEVRAWNKKMVEMC